MPPFIEGRGSSVHRGIRDWVQNGPQGRRPYLWRAGLLVDDWVQNGHRRIGGPLCAAAQRIPRCGNYSCRLFRLILRRESLIRIADVYKLERIIWCYLHRSMLVSCIGTYKLIGCWYSAMSSGVFNFQCPHERSIPSGLLNLNWKH